MQMKMARAGRITAEMKSVARDEKIDAETIRKEIACGKIVITSNSKRKKKIKPLGIGKGLRTKINANIGTSPDCINIKKELEKLKIAVKSGADTIMDLSIGGNLDKIRRTLIRESPVPVGTVPIYQSAIEVARKKGSIVYLTEDEIFSCIEKQAEDGVDFITVHCGVTQKAIQTLKKNPRVMGVVSRGGAFLIEWMVYNKKENPLYEHFDRLLSIAKKYDITLSLGDGFRPGSIADATDSAQIYELITLGELARRAWKEDVQVIIEGPGHIPLHQIAANVLLEKEICQGAPFYVLGPLVTDVAPGYDHITAAIGGAIAASHGADFLCYVTPSEHLKLPAIEDVQEGVVAAKIAAHAADIAKGIPHASDWDRRISCMRHSLNWKEQIKLSVDPVKSKKYRGNSFFTETCTMCGKYCALKLVKDYLKS
ncbi:phosphomethylpyrimidine synthase [Candidatus Desantisbacteria bacterium CG1_02_38_46]|uniref:Phosphomethylpyrimidine synthase n=3 Tax=unclassified Candidatus Desantisiibacteriota TaxID=3106372 RepID=A0A2H9PCD1_9BACT|nr:MAG: phosphomethylpyrimidine synthase [Candidatus Desantisbacteria bacterium CG1_02_38_46]PIU51873.1 MAG: phosphomethylpyrimidine synthase [Candidatus Desantisbacteria bacterium CG07_land_8_20_14_0_80_39_15]PIZ16828.1 MAG: phosphomethylpyrimidine synthase [Candidatus Desantisbacteria bacterium CG_4_10_14_0_8_um_filter_39_17]